MKDELQIVDGSVHNYTWSRKLPKTKPYVGMSSQMNHTYLLALLSGKYTAIFYKVVLSYM